MKKIDEKYFIADEKTHTEIEHLLEKDEKILWRGKPKKTAYIWSEILAMLPIALIWLVFDGIFIATLFYLSPSLPVFVIVILCIFFLLHLAPVWIWLSRALLARKRHKNLDYAFTDKRIIVRTGVIIDFINIYYSEINSVNVRVGLTDKWFNVGDIYIKSTSQAVVLNDITNAYQIGNKLQQITNDIKSDIYYPNNLRPAENAGYKTKLNTEDKK